MTEHPARAASPALDDSTARDLSALKLDDFAPLAQEQARFAATLEGEPGIELVLVEAKSFGSKVEPDSGRPFACLFIGPAESVLTQGIYRLQNPEMGRLEIFLVPIGPHSEGMQYEAVFT